MTEDAKTDERAPSTKAAPSRQSRLILALVIVAVVLGLDLWTKAWAWETLGDGATVTVVENWFYFEFGFNTGSAFSFLRDAEYARAIFIAVTILALLYMARLALTLPTKYGSAFVAVALVSGGALGNLHDRILRQRELRGEMRHGVVDFIKVNYWPDKAWPTFNIADVALVVGVGLLFIFLTRHGDEIDDKKKKGKKKSGKKKRKKVAADVEKKPRPDPSEDDVVEKPPAAIAEAKPEDAKPDPEDRAEA
jgi:signal peptidase II